MTKYSFLNELERRLAKLPEADRKEILRDYEEHFEFAIEAGKSDVEVIEGLGLPEKIAKEVLADYHVELARESRNIGDISNAVKAVLAAGGLGFFNLVFVLGPVMAVGGVIFGFMISGVALTVSPILLLLVTVTPLQAFRWMDFFSSLSLAGIGIFISMATFYMVKWMIALTARYLAFNLRVIKGEDK